MQNCNYTLNIRGRLFPLDRLRVMGILNATPDSFYAASRTTTEEAIRQRARQIVAEGGSMIDVGACSTRPGGEVASEAEEIRRLRIALPAVRREVPDAVISVDTFRPAVARLAVEELGADIINDVTGGTGIPLAQGGDTSFGDSDAMLRTVAQLHVPYVLTSQQPTVERALLFFAQRIEQLRAYGAADVILDPGFGFGKNIQIDGMASREGDYEHLRHLDRLMVFGLPILVGLSRKRMAREPLGITPDESLVATTALHAIAAVKGASILRVHDVREAVQVAILSEKLLKVKSEE